MWDILDCFFALDDANDGIRDNPTATQIICMLAIIVVVIACGYMAFAKGQYAWLAGGAVAILVLIGIIAVAGRFDPT